MNLSLAEMFIQNKGEPLIVGGRQVVMSHRIEVRKDQEVKIEFISSNNNYRQGIELSLDKRKGFIEVNNQKLNSPVFWTDTAPSTFVFKCLPSKKVGQLNIWNVWQYSDREERIDAWIGNSGITVYQQDENCYQFYCSNGVGEIDFEDLVFQVTLQ